jgi:hypothetical protein
MAAIGEGGDTDKPKLKGQPLARLSTLEVSACITFTNFRF